MTENPCGEITLDQTTVCTLPYPEELRCYTFTLVQLNTIQQGVQAAHAAIELGMKAHRRLIRGLNGDEWTIYHEWATEWKTLLFLNGGDALALRELEDFFFSPQNMFPWASFHEDDSLYGALTSMAIVLPARIFGTSENMRKLKVGEFIPHFPFTEWEYQLIERLAAARRAV
jgi:hypothetical protein